MRRSLPALSLCAAALVACGGGGASAAPGSGAEALAVDCTDGLLLTRGAWRVENNTWGKGSLSGWQQCVGLAAGPGDAVAARYTWQWPASGHDVKAYPELIYGHKPGTTSTTTQLPRLVSDLQALQVRYAYTSTHSGIGNTAFDLWLTNTATPGSFAVPPITHEVMVWLDSWGGMVPGGTLRATVALDGATWEVYVGDNFGSGWRYIAFRRTVAQVGAGTLDLKALLDYARTSGLITGGEYLASVEFGNEVVSGSGDTRISEFALTVR